MQIESFQAERKLEMNTKTKKLAAAIFTILLICASFAACGDSNASDDPVVGTWELNQISVMGQEVSVADFLKMTDYDGDDIPTVIFNDDHTVSVDVLGSKGEGKWELQDGKYHITDDTSTSLDFTLEEDVLSVEQSGATLEFTKQK